MVIDPLHRVTIDDVADRVGVHKATVSRALNARTRHQVNEKTAARITAIAQELGYVPNAMARGLRTSSSMTIGVIIPDLTNPFFPPIIRGIENYLQPRGYTALLANTDDSEAIERAALDSLLGRRIDGLVVASGSLQSSTLADAHQAGVFAVMLNRDAGGIPYPLVTGNDATGIAAAVAHLADLGHRRIMHIAGPAYFSTSGTRADAFLAACRGIKGVTGSVVEAAALSVEAGSQSMDRVLTERGPRPTAVVAGNDLVALGVLRSLRAHGLSCPGDVSVVGFNDIEFAQDSNPPLTTVHVPMLEMGTEAARMLLEAIDARTQEPETVRVPVSLIVRGSTGSAPA
ncbi:LacI family DNA-binding transcriptional regulator [Parafrigoribacterium soli]|uniref:LacI family DNA-binding transcriptional regulator n=1 Tax=Parafrigoribacterium soli TaxID=3144663 RepID=UPI0032F07E28